MNYLLWVFQCITCSRSLSYSRETCNRPLCLICVFWSITLLPARTVYIPPICCIYLFYVYFIWQSPPAFLQLFPSPHDTDSKRHVVTGTSLFLCKLKFKRNLHQFILYFFIASNNQGYDKINILIYTVNKCYGIRQ